MWPLVLIQGLEHTMSNHFPILMETNSWGSKPFCFINACCTHPDFKKFLEDAWNNYEYEGWYDYRIKEKLKRLKEDLRKWNREVFGTIEGKFELHKREIYELGLIDDTLGLEEEEIIKRKESPQNLFRSLNQRNSLHAQKSNIKWLMEGDINSSFLHRAINFRRKINEIAGLNINGY